MYFAHSYESGLKGSPNKSSITYDKVEINPVIDDSRFIMPKTGPTPRVAQ